MRFAYADPPYLGAAERYYGNRHSDAASYDDPETHRELLERLSDEFPRGMGVFAQFRVSQGAPTDGSR